MDFQIFAVKFQDYKSFFFYCFGHEIKITNTIPLNFAVFVAPKSYQKQSYEQVWCVDWR